MRGTRIRKRITGGVGGVGGGVVHSSVPLPHRRAQISRSRERWPRFAAGLAAVTDFEALLVEQRGVVTLRQCAEAGVSAGVVLRHVRDGRWQWAGRGVRLVGREPPDHDRRVRAALLSIGGDVVTSHQSALWLADSTSPAPPVAHVAVLDGRKVGRSHGTRVHHLPDLGDDRVVRVGVPRVRVEHTVVDCSGRSRGATSWSSW